MKEGQADYAIEHVNGSRDYLELEWKLFEQDQTRYAATLRATQEIEVRRVLDIGCGAGQEMLPFVESGAQGIGIDASPIVGQVGRTMFERAVPGGKVEFVRASGATLPFKDDSFDVVICRIALMYMDNKAALSEIGRVLRQPGRFLLKYHAPLYYWAKFGIGLKSGHFKSAIHASRVLFAGYYYYFTGGQLFNSFSAGGEIFQSQRRLVKDLAKVGMKIHSEMPDTNNLTPSVLIIRQ
jgi:SAM-dependent methyltransferase